MSLKIQHGRKDYKFLFEAGRVRAGEVLLFEMSIELLIVVEASEMLDIYVAESIEHVLLISNAVPLANEAFLVMFTKMPIQLIIAKETLSAKLAHGMDEIGEPSLCFLLCAKPSRMGRRQVQAKGDVGIEGVFVGEYFLMTNT
jgi:hypothetical protein